MKAEADDDGGEEHEADDEWQEGHARRERLVFAGLRARDRRRRRHGFCGNLLLRAIEEGADFGQGAAAGRIDVKAPASDLGEGRGDGCGQYWLGVAGGIPDGLLLREGFDKGDAERPDIGSWGGWIGCELGGDVNLAARGFGDGLPDGKQAVG